MMHIELKGGGNSTVLNTDMLSVCDDRTCSSRLRELDTQ